MEQMGFMHLWSASDYVAKFVFTVVAIMMAGTLYFIFTASMRNFAVRSRAHKVIETFWQTTNPQEAIRAMESQPANEPFSKIALECANAAAHHAQASTLLALANWIAEQTGATAGYLTEAANTVGAQWVKAVPAAGGMNAAQMISGNVKAAILLNVERSSSLCGTKVLARTLRFT